MSKYTDFISAWSYLGGSYSVLNENGFLHSDLNKGNIIYNEDEHLLRLVDFSYSDVIDYPNDWEKIPKGLMSLFRWLDIEFIAAFRFGYIMHGGRIAETVFDFLREKYGLYSRDTEGAINPLIRYQVSGIVEYDQSWKELRSMFPYEMIKDISIFQHNEWKREREKILGTLFNDPKKIRMTFSSKLYHKKELVEELVDEYYYKNHLDMAFRNRNIHGMIEALNYLYGICISRKEYTKAFGLAKLCNQFQEYSDNIGDEEKKQYEDDEEKISKISDIFTIIWDLDDLEHGGAFKHGLSNSAKI